MAARKESVIAAVLLTRMSTRSCARSSAEAEAASNFSISCACAAKARTTRMPAEVLLHHRGSGPAAAPAGPARSGAAAAARPRTASPTDGHEAQRQQPEQQRSMRSSTPPPMPISTLSSTKPDQARGKEHAHAFEVEKAQRDEVARMDAVVEAEAQPLDLVVVGEPQVDSPYGGRPLRCSSSGRWRRCRAGSTRQARRPRSTEAPAAHPCSRPRHPASGPPHVREVAE